MPYEKNKWWGYTNFKKFLKNSQQRHCIVFVLYEWSDSEWVGFDLLYILFVSRVLGFLNKWVLHNTCSYALVIIYNAFGVLSNIGVVAVVPNYVVPSTLRTGVFILYTFTPFLPALYRIWRVSTAMANSYRAPKQCTLSTNGSVNSFENWKQNMLYIITSPQLCTLPFKWFSVSLIVKG